MKALLVPSLLFLLCFFACRSSQLLESRLYEASKPTTHLQLFYIYQPDLHILPNPLSSSDVYELTRGIQRQLLAKGYHRVSTPQDADLLVYIGVSSWFHQTNPLVIHSPWPFFFGDRQQWLKDYYQEAKRYDGQGTTGAVLIDIVAPATQELIFSGVVDQCLPAFHQSGNVEVLHRSLAQLLRNLPMIDIY